MPERSLPRIGVAKVGTTQIGGVEARSVQACAEEAGIAEVGPQEARSLKSTVEVRLAQVATQSGVLQVCALEVWSGRPTRGPDGRHAGLLPQTTLRPASPL